MPIAVRLPFNEGSLIALFHEQGQVEVEEHAQGGVVIHGRLPGRLLATYQPFSLTNLPQIPAEEE
jgi:GTP-binding protein HflX